VNDMSTLEITINVNKDFFKCQYDMQKRDELCHEKLTMWEHVRSVRSIPHSLWGIKRLFM